MKIKKINKIAIWIFLWTTIWSLWFFSKTKKWKNFFKNFVNNIKLWLKEMKKTFNKILRKKNKRK